MAARDGKALSIAFPGYISAFMTSAEEYTLLASKMPAVAASAGHLPTAMKPDVPYSRRNLSPEAAALDVVLQGAKESGPRFLESGFADTGGILTYPNDPPSGIDFRTRPWYTAMQSASGSAVTLYKSVANEEVVCSLSRVIKYDGKAAGVFYLEISLNFITNRLKSIQSRKTDRFIVVNNEGFVVASANTKVLMTRFDANPSEPIAILGTLPVGAHVVEVNGSTRLAVVHVDSQGWKYIYTAETNELLQGTYQLLVECGLITVGSLLIMFLLGWGILRKLNRELYLLDETTHKIANGDIDEPLPNQKNFSGELLKLYMNFTKMVDSIRSTIKLARQNEANALEHSQRAQESLQKAEKAEKEALTKAQTLLRVADKLEEVGNAVASASSQLSAQIEDSDRGASEAAARLSEAATAMNEMNVSVQEVARNASAASEASSETRHKAEVGSQVVERSLRRIEAVHLRQVSCSFP